jgi:hypothetical protein
MQGEARRANVFNARVGCGFCLASRQPPHQAARENGQQRFLRILLRMLSTAGEGNKTVSPFKKDYLR